MTESIYKEYQNKYYNPNDNDKKPGDNDNWKSIQKGFHDIGTTQLETSAGLTLGKGTEDEVSVTAAELEEMKNAAGLDLVIIGGGIPQLMQGETIPSIKEDGTRIYTREYAATGLKPGHYYPLDIRSLGGTNTSGVFLGEIWLTTTAPINVGSDGNTTLGLRMAFVNNSGADVTNVSGFTGSFVITLLPVKGA